MESELKRTESRDEDQYEQEWGHISGAPASRSRHGRGVDSKVRSGRQFYEEDVTGGRQWR